MNNREKIKSKIRSIPGFPKEGIIFRDITTLIQDPEGLQLVVDELASRYAERDIDIIAGIEARGFTVGAALAYKLGKGLVLVRKAGKLPHTTVSHEYELEYGTDKIEIHTDAIKSGERVLVIDDLLATGGTSIAAAKLLEKIGGEVVEMAYIVDLPDVGGRASVADTGYSMFALCEFEGE